MSKGMLKGDMYADQAGWWRGVVLGLAQGVFVRTVVVRVRVVSVGMGSSSIVEVVSELKADRIVDST